MTTGKALNGEPYAGNPHVRFDEGEVASAATPRRGSLLYKTRLIAAIALAFAAMTAAAAKKIEIKVIDSSSDGINYWVKYSFNGIECRSDMMGKEFNKKAWQYMSDEDRMKTVKAVTYVWDARQEQFGDLAFEMGRWYDEKMGWTEAAGKLQEGLVKKYHPELWERFSSGKIDEYISKSVTPAGVPANDDLSDFPKLWAKYEGLKFIFGLACDAYATLGPAEYRRTEAAVKSTSGDLIQLICDRVLVPNITPSGMLSGIEAIPSKIFGAVLDMANTLSGAQDKLVEKVVGARTTADKARLVIDNANSAIAINKNIITTCMSGVQSLRAEIESEYPKLKEARDKREKEVKDAYKAKLQEARDARKVAGMSSEAMEQAEQLGALIKTKDDANTRYDNARARYYAMSPDDEGRSAVYDEMQRALEKATKTQQMIDEYTKVVFKRLVERCHSWMMTYFGDLDGSHGGYEDSYHVGGLIGTQLEKYDALRKESPSVENDLARLIMQSSKVSSFNGIT